MVVSGIPVRRHSAELNLLTKKIPEKKKKKKKTKKKKKQCESLNIKVGFDTL